MYNTLLSIIFQLLVGVMAVLLYKVEARKAKIRRARANKAKAHRRTTSRVEVKTFDLVDDPIVEKTPKVDNVIDVVKDPLTVNQMVKLIEANADRLTRTHYYTLQVAYGLEKVPFEVNLKDSLQWICEQLGLTTTVQDESYLKLKYAFYNKQLTYNL